MDDAMAASFGVDAVHDEVVVAEGRVRFGVGSEAGRAREEDER
jgi:hypothetical protein